MLLPSLLLLLALASKTSQTSSLSCPTCASYQACFLPAYSPSYQHHLLPASKGRYRYHHGPVPGKWRSTASAAEEEDDDHDFETMRFSKPQSGEQLDEQAGTVWDDFEEILLHQNETAADRYFMKKSVPYYFLRDELGINEAKMLRISLDHGPVLALSVERSLRPKVQWLREALRLTRAEAAQVVGASPGALLLSVEDNLEPKLRWLKDELGLAEEERRRIVLRCPQILTASTGSLLMKLAFFKDDVGLGRIELHRALRTMPALLVLSLDTLVDKAEYLTTELGMTMEDIGILLVRAPALFFQALDTGLKPKIRFLRREVGLATEKEVRQLILKAPRLLNYRIVARGRPFLQYLTRNPLNFTREEAQRLILRSPSLLTTDVASPRFIDTMQALKNAMGVRVERELSDIILRFPMVLSFTAARIKRSLAVFANNVGCRSEEVRTLLQKHPQVLGYRPESVLQKLEAIVEIYGFSSVADVKKSLLKAPALLSYSLKARLRPRLEAAADVGVPLEKAVTWLPLADDKYEERLGCSTTEEVISLADAPLLRQRSNAQLRKLLRSRKEDDYR